MNEYLLPDFGPRCKKLVKAPVLTPKGGYMSIDEIKQRLAEPNDCAMCGIYRKDIAFLLAEVERLQVEIQVRDSLLGPVIDDTLKGGE